MATVFIYLSDVEMGGHTLFPYAKNYTKPETSQEHKDEVERLKQELFPNKPDMHSFVDECETKMSVQPKVGDAVLFYSTNRNGKLDIAATHGACPVLKGEKWGANLWIWNGPFFTVDRQARLASGKTIEEGPIDVIFSNFLTDKTITLNWVGFDKKPVFQTEMKAGAHFNSHTYAGHEFNAVLDGTIVKIFEMHKKENHYTLTEEDLRAPPLPTDVAPPLATADGHTEL